MAERSFGQVFMRPPRIQDEGIEGEIDIPKPPPEQRDTARNLLLSLLPMSGILVMALFFLFISSSTGRPPIFVVPMLAMAFVSIISGFLTYSLQRHQQRQEKIRKQRDYHRLLDRRTARLQAARDLQLYLRKRRFPPPDTLMQQIGDYDVSLWNRRRGDNDFSEVRLGLGTIPSLVTIPAIDPDVEAPDLRRALRLIFDYRDVPNAPLTLNLHQVGSIGIVGKRQSSLPFAYMLIMQLVALHAPVDIELYVFSSHAGHQSWNWARWLPHTSATQSGGFPDYIAYDDKKAGELMGRLAERFHDSESGAAAAGLTIVVFDPPMIRRNDPIFEQIIGGQNHGVLAISLSRDVREIPEGSHALVHVDQDRFTVHLVGEEAQKYEGRSEAVSLVQIDSVARYLANLQMKRSGVSNVPDTVDFIELYPQWRVTFLRQKWERIPNKGVLPLPAPIGKIDPANPIYLNLSEEVDGPHGMIAGTTGSGKSVLLESLVLSLAIEHHPNYLNFLLIDFKGGATFKPFEKLPHTVGTLSNIDGDDPAQANNEALRVLEVIDSENLRRQHIFKRHDVQNITEYQVKLNEARSDPQHPANNWEPMPHLLIIIDEFAELATEQPDFLPQLVSTVRVGRSLGMHLILAMQRPGNHVREEMRANLQFRICLRVQSAEDSRDMLNRPEAVKLKGKGQGYFQSGNSGLRMFQTAYAGGDFIPQGDTQNEDFDLYYVEYGQRQRLESIVNNEDDQNDYPKVVQKMTDDLVALSNNMKIPALRRLLPPALPVYLGLPPLFHEYRFSGWNDSEKSWGEMNRIPLLEVPIGIIDDLAAQTIRPLTVNLEQRGHMMIMGAPSTGKSTLLRTIIMSFARLLPPNLLEMYVLNYSGNVLNDMADLPHVGAVIKMGEDERLHRLLSYLQDQRIEREQALKRLHGVENIHAYNQSVTQLAGTTANGSRSLRPLPPIIVLIDNFQEIRSSYPDLVSEIQSLMNARDLGIYFIITANQSNDVASGIQSNIVEQRIALRMPEKSDYTLFVGSPGERGVLNKPGRGLVRVSTSNTPLHIQIALSEALPDDMGVLEAQEIIAAVNARTSDTIQEMRDTRILSSAMDIITMPNYVPLNAGETIDTSNTMLEVQRPLLLQVAAHKDRLSSSRTVPIGLESRYLTPYMLDLVEQGPHFLVNGPRMTGKTNLLQALALGLIARYSPEDVNFVLADPKNGGLRLFRNAPHVIDYVTEPDQLAHQLACLQALLEQRTNELEALKNSTSQDANQESPFRPVFVIIDNYDQLLIDTPPALDKALRQIGNYARQGESLGFHLIIAAETSGLPNHDYLTRQIRNGGSGFALVTAEAVELMNRRATVQMRQQQLPDGRGYVITRTDMNLVQFAVVIPDSVDRVINTWDASDYAGVAVWSDEVLEAVTTLQETQTAEPAASVTATTEDISSASWFDMGGAMDAYLQQQGYDNRPETEDDSEQ